MDVWSLGVILYQMLFGRRPFGDGCTQAQLLRDQVMLNARTVSFPTKPAVSAEAKAFILQCASALTARPGYSGPCLLASLTRLAVSCRPRIQCAGVSHTVSRTVSTSRAQLRIHIFC